MSETKVRRTVDERLAEVDTKIEFHKEHLAALESRRKLILNPPARKARASMQSVIKLAKEAGMTPEEIAKKLGL